MGYEDQSHKYYFDHPEIWEAISSERLGRESIFLLETLEKYYRGQIKDILDVGCGTGCHLSRLSELGIRGVGIDLNPAMVKFASEKSPNLRFSLKDMRHLDYMSEFDGILCLCTTFSYNRTSDEILTSLGGFAKALRDGGILIIDVPNAIGFIQKREFQETIEEKYEKLNLRTKTLNTIDEAEQVLKEKRTFFAIADDRELRTDTTIFRLFFPQEIRFLLATAGFDFLEFYGSYDSTHTTLNGSQMIVVARKSQPLR